MTPWFSRVFKRFSTIRAYSSCSQLSVLKQNDIFNVELARQKTSVGRIEKIVINYEGVPEQLKFVMNKNISTPLNVAQHISEWIAERAALALVNSSQVWDMHRPLENNCDLRFLTFTDSDPYELNRAFWRSCSFILGAVIKNAFSEGIEVTLHSFPSPHISSGSFVHDATLSLTDWIPSSDELKALSGEMVKFCLKNLPIERLQVSAKIAQEIFEDNKFKLKHIPKISESLGGTITLYRVGNHIDISKGPMIANTSFVGRCTITAVHKLESDNEHIFRFQGVALPKGLMLNHFAYKILEDRAKKLNMKTSFLSNHRAELTA